MAINDPFPWVHDGPGLEDRFKTLFDTAAPVLSGESNQRPNRPPVGTMFFDTTLGKPIWWNGNHWQDATGSIV